MQREMADGFTKRNSMDMLATPLGEWERVREETTGRVFLVGEFLQMPVSVELESADICWAWRRGHDWLIVGIALLALNLHLAAGRGVGALFIGKACFRFRSRMGFW